MSDSDDESTAEAHSAADESDKMSDEALPANPSGVASHSPGLRAARATLGTTDENGTTLKGWHHPARGTCCLAMNAGWSEVRTMNTGALPSPADYWIAATVYGVVLLSFLTCLASLSVRRRSTVLMLLSLVLFGIGWTFALLTLRQGIVDATPVAWLARLTALLSGISLLRGLTRKHQP
jgi:hypothetical protein